MENHLKIIGSILILLAGIHLFFPKYFHWKKELKSLSLINRQMMQVHTFFIALTLLLMGFLCFNFSFDLVHSKLGKPIALGFCLFWLLRLIFQLFVYSPKLWKGKIIESAIHVFFIFLWTYFTVVFLLIGLDKSFTSF